MSEIPPPNISERFDFQHFAQQINNRTFFMFFFIATNGPAAIPHPLRHAKASGSLKTAGGFHNRRMVSVPPSLRRAAHLFNHSVPPATLREEAFRLAQEPPPDDGTRGANRPTRSHRPASSWSNSRSGSRRARWWRTRSRARSSRRRASPRPPHTSSRGSPSRSSRPCSP